MVGSIVTVISNAVFPHSPLINNAIEKIETINFELAIFPCVAYSVILNGVLSWKPSD